MRERRGGRGFKRVTPPGGGAGRGGVPGVRGRVAGAGPCVGAGLAAGLQPLLSPHLPPRGPALRQSRRNCLRQGSPPFQTGLHATMNAFRQSHMLYGMTGRWRRSKPCLATFA